MFQMGSASSHPAGAHNDRAYRICEYVMNFSIIAAHLIFIQSVVLYNIPNANGNVMVLFYDDYSNVSFLLQLFYSLTLLCLLN